MKLLRATNTKRFEVIRGKIYENESTDYKALVSKMGGDNKERLKSVVNVTREIILKDPNNGKLYHIYTSHNIPSSIIDVEYEISELKEKASEIIETYSGGKHKICSIWDVKEKPQASPT